MHAAPQPRADAVQAEAARLYAAHRRWIYALCRGRLASREDAEDAVQLTFLYALRSLQRDIRPEREFAWLRTIADNVCRTRRRDASSRARVEAVSDVHAVEHLLPAQERADSDVDALRAVLETLTEGQRRALLLREWKGLSYREIATELGLSEPAVETLLFRARRRVAQGLGEARRAFDVVAALRWLRALRCGAAVKAAAATVSVGVVAVTAGPPLVRHLERVLHPARHGPAAVVSSPAASASSASPSIALPAPSRGAAHRARTAQPRARLSGLPVGLTPAAPGGPAAAAPPPTQAQPDPTTAAAPRQAATRPGPAGTAQQQPQASAPPAQSSGPAAPSATPVDTATTAVDAAASTATSAVTATVGAATSALSQATSTATTAVNTATSAVDSAVSSVPVPSVPAPTPPVPVPTVPAPTPPVPKLP